METIAITVNGHAQEFTVPPQTPLIFILRNDLGLTGTKLGCGLEQCGSCAVIKDGKKILACTTPLEACQGGEVTTIEGLGNLAQLHPLQEAFVEARAAQCGYCIPGIIIATKVLFDQNPHPDENTIRQALSSHLCRCGAHPRILKAIQKVAKQGTP